MLTLNLDGKKYIYAVETDLNSVDYLVPCM